MKPPLPRSLFSRLILVLVSGLIAAQLAAGIVLYQEQIRTFYQAGGLQSAQRISEIVQLLERHSPGERERLINVLNTSRLRIEPNSRPWQSPDNGRSNAALTGLFRSILQRNLGGERPLQVSVIPAKEHAAIVDDPPRGMGRGRGMGRHHRMMHMQPATGLYFLARIQLSDKSWITFDHRIPDQSADWPWRLLLTVTILLTAVVVLAILAVRWLTRPLTTLADAAERLGRDLNNPPIAEQGPTEVKRAATAFNTMQARLRLFIEDRSRILAAVSHDLKTPLTRLRLRTEALEDETLKRKIRNDLDEMQAMTAATLDFLRGLESHEAVQPVDIRALIESLIDDFEESGQRIELKGDSPPPYPARPLALKRCIENLLNNALKYGQDTQVEITQQPPWLTIAVINTAPAIPEERLEQLFEPFYRLETSRNRDTGGTGLGLSIARNIARSHGGELIIRNRSENRVEAVLSLPC